MNILILRLAGPMQSWGVQSRFSVRDTGREPSKSGVIGILCAALGFRRTDREHDYRDRTIPFSELTRLEMAVRVDREGLLRRDYHTAGGGKFPGRDRYGVAKANRGTPGTVVSTRYYLADADFRVALGSPDLELLRLLELALRNPIWPIALGRKSFVPVCPVVVDRPPDGSVRADCSALEALQREPIYFRNDLERQHWKDRPQVRCVLENANQISSSEIRPDVPLSFDSREFTIRHVATTFITLSSDQLEEDPSCTSHASY